MSSNRKKDAKLKLDEAHPMLEKVGLKHEVCSRAVEDLATNFKIRKLLMTMETELKLERMEKAGAGGLEVADDRMSTDFRLIKTYYTTLKVDQSILPTESVSDITAVVLINEAMSAAEEIKICPQQKLNYFAKQLFKEITLREREEGAGVQDDSSQAQSGQDQAGGAD